MPRSAQINGSKLNRIDRRGEDHQGAESPIGDALVALEDAEDDTLRVEVAAGKKRHTLGKSLREVVASVLSLTVSQPLTRCGSTGRKQNISTSINGVTEQTSKQSITLRSRRGKEVELLGDPLRRSNTEHDIKKTEPDQGSPSSGSVREFSRCTLEISRTEARSDRLQRSHSHSNR